jgi:hypothetical protein
MRSNTHCGKTAEQRCHSNPSSTLIRAIFTLIHAFFTLIRTIPASFHAISTPFCRSLSAGPGHYNDEP